MASKSPTPLSKFISSSPAFSVDQYYGLNSQPRLMSAELISSLNEHRAKLLDEYINNAHGSNDEIIKTIENVDSSLDPIQVQWLRDGVEKIIVSDPQSKTSIAFKAQIMLSDLATNDESENLDFEYIYNFVKDKSVFSMKGRYLHETIATVLTNEINELEKANLSKKQKSDRINQLIEATKLSSIDEIVVNLKSAIEHRLDNIIEDVEEFQNRQSELEKLDNYASVNKLSFNQSNNNVTDQHIELIASDENLMDNALGSIEMKSEGKSFNYIKSQNLSKEIRKIMETNKITINTEFRSIGFGITQYENIGGKIKTTSTTKSKVGKFIDNLVGKSTYESYSDKIERQKTTRLNDDGTEFFDPFIDGRAHNEQLIKKIEFKDNKNEIIFTHKPNSRFSVFDTSNKTGGKIVFSKGRIINQQEATLMVAQFLKTNTSGEMHITPPKHLPSQEHTIEHIRLIISAGLQLGMELPEIHIKPNGIVSKDEIKKIMTEFDHNLKNDDVNEYGGLSGSEVSNDEKVKVDNKNGIIKEQVLQTKKAEKILSIK